LIWEVIVLSETVKRDDNGRDNKGRFTAGNKGGGRPAVAQDFRQRCRAYMETQGWDALISIANTTDDKDRQRALELIAAYAYGKPKQGVELTGEDGAPVNIGVVVLPAVKADDKHE
jgi:hypothetical protein